MKSVLHLTPFSSEKGSVIYGLFITVGDFPITSCTLTSATFLPCSLYAPVAREPGPGCSLPNLGEYFVVTRVLSDLYYLTILCSLLFFVSSTAGVKSPT